MFENSRNLQSDEGGLCNNLFDCRGALNCCGSAGPSLNGGYCYPVCNRIVGDFCSDHVRCGTGLACCNSACVPQTSYT